VDRLSPITRRNVIQYEFIGLDAKVVKSIHPGYVGIRGRIIDETKNTIVIMEDNGKKRVQKSVVVLHLRPPEGAVVEIDGKQIVGRPVSRVKKKARR